MNLSAASGLAIERNVPLSSHTTIKIGGPAAYFTEPKDEGDLFKVIHWARQEGIAWFILGNGSNVIFSDEGYDGLVISLRRFKREMIEVNPGGLTATVSSGVPLARFVRACQEAGLSGSEFLAHIPGTVGGALVMNAGFSRHTGQRNEIRDIVESVRVVGVDGDIQTLSCADVEFRYRGSNLKGRIILDVKFQLWKRSKEQIQQEIKANLEHRKEKQGIHEPNAGSVFKNPTADAPAAGILIERAGLKGKRVGGIEVSQQHANYFINKSDGTCADFLALMKEVQKAVFDAASITLEPEVQIIQKS